MAESEQVAWLHTGSEAWWKYRQEKGINKPDLEKADLAFCRLAGVRLELAELSEANMSDSNFNDARFNGSKLVGSQLDNSDLTRAEFTKANLTNAVLFGSNLSGARFESAVLTGANFAYATISPSTDVRRAKFGDAHDPHLDGDENVKFARMRDRILDWGKIRGIGSLPLFGASYVSLAGSLLVINGIGFLNSTKVVLQVNYPIPIPERAVLVMISSLLLAGGSTIYKLCCPSTVQEYSETNWLQELRKSVLIYRVDRIQGWWAQLLTLVLITAGGTLAAYLLAEQIVRAVTYAIELPIG
jgi:hypothetical protein